TVQYFHVLATNGHCACVALRLVEAPEPSSECIATLDAAGALGVLLVPGEQIPGLPDECRVTSVREARISETGMVALLVRARTTKDRRPWERPCIVVASPDGKVRLVASALHEGKGARQVPQ